MKALKTAHKPSIIEWLIPIGLLLAGVFLLLKMPQWSGIKESELIIAEGIPSEVKLITISSGMKGKSETLEFKVAGHSLQYATGDLHYNDVKSVLATQEPVKAWLFQHPALFRIGEFAQLYQLTVGGRKILSYDETESQNEASDKQRPILPLALIGLALFALFIIWTQLQNFNSKAGSPR